MNAFCQERNKSESSSLNQLDRKISQKTNNGNKRNFFPNYFESVETKGFLYCGLVGLRANCGKTLKNAVPKITLPESQCLRHRKGLCYFKLCGPFYFIILVFFFIDVARRFHYGNLLTPPLFCLSILKVNFQKNRRLYN